MYSPIFGVSQEVQTGGNHLVIRQKLCCVRRCRDTDEEGKCDEGKGTVKLKYQPCNGSREFNKNCDDDASRK